MDPKRICNLLGLEPLQPEGGFFRETYRSKNSTAIYYLLTPETHSALHRLPGDEIYHFYLGDPVEMLLLKDGEGEIYLLGSALSEGVSPQRIVPGGTWQGSRLKEGGRFALLGTTMAPGFSFDQYECADAASLALEYPAFAPLIHILQ